MKQWLKRLFRRDRVMVRIEPQTDEFDMAVEHLERACRDFEARATQFQANPQNARKLAAWIHRQQQAKPNDLA